MLELTLVFGLMALLSLAVWLMNFAFSPLLWVELGLFLLGIGLLEGVPTGLIYHWTLYKMLRRRGPLPPRWLLHPTDHHAGLTEAERRRVMRWFTLGAFGFVLCIAGGLLALGAVMFGKF